MANDNINTQQNTVSTFSPTTNVITQLTESEDVTIRRPANHNEISIMENDWKQIRRKVNKLQISKHYDIPKIILGTIIPYVIDVIANRLNNQNPNYLPLIVCLALFILSIPVAKQFPILGSDNSEANLVHLNDLNDLLDQADSSNSYNSRESD